jgi:hypothetical protein
MFSGYVQGAVISQYACGDTAANAKTSAFLVRFTATVSHYTRTVAPGINDFSFNRHFFRVCFHRDLLIAQLLRSEFLCRAAVCRNAFA